VRNGSILYTLQFAAYPSGTIIIIIVANCFNPKTLFQFNLGKA
jgi:hypothetical protein